MFFKKPKKNAIEAGSPSLQNPRKSRNDRPAGLSGQKGIAALELAILLPLLMLILFGIIEWGYVFYVDLSLTSAVREGARVGVTRTDTTTAENDAQNVTQNYLSNIGLFSGNCSLNCATVAVQMLPPQDGETNIEVTASIPNFETPIGFLPEGARPSSLSARAIMRWEMSGTP